MAGASVARLTDIHSVPLASGGSGSVSPTLGQWPAPLSLSMWTPLMRKSHMDPGPLLRGGKHTHMHMPHCGTHTPMHKQVQVRAD